MIFKDTWLRIKNGSLKKEKENTKKTQGKKKARKKKVCTREKQKTTHIRRR